MEVARTTATGLLLIRLGSSAPSLPGLWPPTLIKGDAIGGARENKNRIYTPHHSNRPFLQTDKDLDPQLLDDPLLIKDFQTLLDYTAS